MIIRKELSFLDFFLKWFLYALYLSNTKHSFDVDEKHLRIARYFVYSWGWHNLKYCNQYGTTFAEVN